MPIVFCCYYKPPRSGSTGKETKIQKEGTRGGRGSPDQNESLILGLSNALQFVRLVRVVVEILMIEIFLSVFLKVVKNAQVNWG